jgi:MoxR-like ATPase
MLCHRLDYPTPDEEKEILRRNAALGIRREDKGAIARTEFDVLDKSPVGDSEDLIAAMQAVQDVYISDVFVDHIVELVNRTRIHPALEVGCSPRAGIALIKSSRARALIQGRGYVIPEDMYALAEDVILHRVRLNYEALADGFTGEFILREIMNDMGLTASTIA